MKTLKIFHNKLLRCSTPIVLSLFLMVLNVTLLNAQQKDIMVHRVVLKKMNGERELGYLYSLDDSGITLAKLKEGQYEVFSQIPVAEIKKIKIRRKGSVLRGAVWGTLSGALGGVILGATTSAGKDCEGGFWTPTGECTEKDRGEQTLGYAIIFGVLGGSTGAIIGTGNKKYSVNGLVQPYQIFRKQWQPFTIRDQTL